jgi:hypothetical protein
VDRTSRDCKADRVEYVVWWLLINLWWIIALGILLASGFLALTLLRAGVRRKREASGVVHNGE